MDPLLGVTRSPLSNTICEHVTVVVYLHLQLEIFMFNYC